LIPRPHPPFQGRKTPLNRQAVGSFGRQAIERLQASGQDRPIPVEACRALRNLLLSFEKEMAPASGDSRFEVPPSWKALVQWEAQSVTSPNRQFRVLWTPSFAGAHLLILDAQGKKVVYSAIEGYNYSPVWSPDGRSCAYLRYRDGETEIWNVPLGDRSPKRLGAKKIDCLAILMWNADGKAVRLRLPGDNSESVFALNGSEPAVQATSRQ